MGLKNKLKLLPPFNLKYQFLDRRHGPIISQERGKLSFGDGPFTFVLICGADFNQRKPNAATKCRLDRKSVV